MSVAEEFARLMAGVNVQTLPAPSFPAMAGTGVVPTRTVYSVGEAIEYRERSKHAKLGAGTF